MIAAIKSVAARVRRRLATGPRTGRVRFGSLRRLTPISRNYGFDRGKCIDRYYIEEFLASCADDIRGHVVEIAVDVYARKFGGDRVTKCDILDFWESNKRATIQADLTQADHIPSDTFDCIILTQVLPFVYDFRAAMRTLHRTLKPGGVLLATFPGISQISHHDMERWGDYWRFTSLAARLLFEEDFPPANVSVKTFGNVLTATALIYGLAAEELSRREMDHHDANYQVTIAVRAVKPPTP